MAHNLTLERLGLCEFIGTRERQYGWICNAFRAALLLASGKGMFRGQRAAAGCESTNTRSSARSDSVAVNVNQEGSHLVGARGWS